MSKKVTSFLVLADSHQAKIYQKVGDKEFNLFLIHTLKADLDSNHEKMTSTFNSTGAIRHGVEPHTDRREVEHQKFARAIANYLEDEDKKGHIEGLIIIASHQMMEYIEKTLSKHLHQKILHKLSKDIVKLTDLEVKEYLEKVAV